MKETLNSLIIKKILPPPPKPRFQVKLKEPKKENFQTLNEAIPRRLKPSVIFFVALLAIAIFFHFFPIFKVKKPLKKDFKNAVLLESLEDGSSKASGAHQAKIVSINAIPSSVNSPKLGNFFKIMDARALSVSLNEIGDREGGFSLENDGDYALSDYVVKEKDSLWSVANEKNVDADSIVSLNRINANAPLKVGQILKISSHDGIFIQTKPFDSLESLSQRYRVNKKIIQNDNPKLNENYLESGQTLFLRGAHYSSKERNALYGRFFSMPLSKPLVVSSYGLHGEFFQSGVNLASFEPSKIRASTSGKVQFAGKSKEWGNLVIIQSKNNYVVYYSNLKSVSARNGEILQQGDVLGEIAAYDKTSEEGAYLHFEVRQNGKILNPNRFLSLDP